MVDWTRVVPVMIQKEQKLKSTYVYFIDRSDGKFWQTVWVIKDKPHCLPGFLILRNYKHSFHFSRRPVDGKCFGPTKNVNCKQGLTSHRLRKTWIKWEVEGIPSMYSHIHGNLAVKSRILLWRLGVIKIISLSSLPP